MIRFATASLAALAALASPADAEPAAAGRFQAAQIAAEANWFAHLDIAALRRSQTGQELIDGIDPHTQKQLVQLERLLKFHPINDVDSLTVYGLSKDPEQAVALVHGTFDTARLASVAAEGAAYSTSDHHGHTIHSWEDGGARIFAQLVSPQLIAIGPDLKLVKLATDVAAGRSQALDENDIFGHTPGDAPILIASAKLSALGALDIDSALARRIEAVYLAAGESSGKLQLAAALQTSDERSAVLVDQMLHGLLAFAEATGEVPAEITKAFATELSGDGIRLDLALPVREFKQLVAQVEKAAEGLK